MCLLAMPSFNPGHGFAPENLQLPGRLFIRVGADQVRHGLHLFPGSTIKETVGSIEFFNKG